MWVNFGFEYAYCLDLFIPFSLLCVFFVFIALEQIKAKERYQMRQINVKTKNEAMANYNKVNMGPNQVESMKDVLRQDGEQIATNTKRLQRLKKELM